MKAFAISTAFLVVLMLSPAISFGQVKKHDISLHYGLLTTPEIFDNAGNYTLYAFDEESVLRENTSLFGGFGGTFRYFFTDIQSVAMVIGYTKTNADLSSGSDVIGESLREFYTIAAEWDIHFLRLETYQMYGGGGIGVTFIFEDNSFYLPGYNTYSDSRVYPNFDFTIIGLRFGRQIGGFVEFGFGYKGLLRFGVSGQF